MVLIRHQVVSWATRGARVVFVMAVAFTSLTLAQPKVTSTASPTNKISNETLDNVIYADIAVIENVDATVALGKVSSDDTTVDTTEALTYEAIQTAEDTYSSEREKEGKEIAKKLKAEQKAEEEAKAEANAKLTYDPYTKSNLTVKQYNNILKGTVLAGEGQSYYDMEQKYNVNGLFAVAVAFHESGYGEHQANTNNCYGMRGNNGWMAFSSLRENILYFGKLMQKDWYFGKSIDGIAKVYCPPTSSDWAASIKNMMDKSFAKR